MVFDEFEFQIIHAVLISNKSLVVLLQSGELIRMNTISGDIQSRSHFLNCCIWDMQQHPVDKRVIYTATDHGVTKISFTQGKFNHANIRYKVYSVGAKFIKAVKIFNNGDFAFISREKKIIKCSEQGEILWMYVINSIPRGLDINKYNTRCMVSTDAGKNIEFDASTGKVVNKIFLTGPSYCCVYTKDNRKIINCEHLQKIFIFGENNLIPLGEIQMQYRVKRMINIDEKIFASGMGGFLEIDINNFQVKKSFGKFMNTTKENGIIINN